MDPIMQIANKHGLTIVEDAAQAIGSKYKSKPSGSIGDVGCFSTHPLKNLNACGDGGFLTTNDEKIYLKAKALRNHGMVDRDRVDNFGYVSRMDNLQAAILNYRLKKLDEIIDRRRQNAQSYLEYIEKEEVFIPREKEYEFNTYHTFVIQVEKRNQLKEFLLKKGIETAIHYPTPIHLQLATKSLGYKLGDLPITEKQAGMILTLPVNQSLGQSEIERICVAVNEYYS
jgi:dTDP-4-amino-4,6-dideoxygalactose transaminase